jgi:hypothetical protein
MQGAAAQGVQCRGRYLHDGSAASLEELLASDLPECHIRERIQSGGATTEAI